MKLLWKIWLWAFEFCLKRKKDDEKIEFMVQQLLNEIETQGNILSDSSEFAGIYLWLHGTKLRIEGGHGDDQWSIHANYNRKDVTK